VIRAGTRRHPGNFVKLVTTVDHMSGGRIEVGVGAGWNDEDHDPLGIPYPEMDARADWMEDQLAILHGLWTEPDGWDFDGHHVKVRGGALHPRPVDAPGRPHGRPGGSGDGRVRPRVLTGGQGTPRGFRIAVKYADEFNLTSSSATTAKAKMAELDTACRAAGRDPSSLTRSSMVGVLLGADAAGLRRTASAIQVEFDDASGNADAFIKERRSRWIVGTPDEARATIRDYAAAGIERIMLQDFVPRDLDYIDLLASELIGKV
jgi:alkanesulfonate monooxygenase SsuD/methylene tetrahydromethanopterin reductase-like flavin-dependent oxidoreductase (luciferase family)